VSVKSLPVGKRAGTVSPRRARIPDDLEASHLRERLADLEARVRALSASRRVLINLLVSTDRKRRLEVSRLKAEIDRLRSRNRVYSRALAERRVVIHRLRRRLEEAAPCAGGAAYRRLSHR